MNKKEMEKREKYYSDESITPPECDILCRFRICYNKYEDKGRYTTGRGYTEYNKTFIPACGTRLSNGCPESRETGGDLNVIKALKDVHKSIGTGKKNLYYAEKLLGKIIEYMERENIKETEK